MEFENIKVGDTVYIKKEVTIGWNEGRLFTIPIKVIRVTKTQFTTEGSARYKKDGRKIGDSRYFENASVSGEDQTEEMSKFKALASLCFKINNSNLPSVRISEIDAKKDAEKIMQIAGLLVRVEQLIDELNNK